MGNQDIPQLFQRLEKALDSEDYSSALQTSNEILSNSADDKDALECKRVSLIHLGRFDEALTAVSESNKLQHAYCLYKLDRLDEAYSTLSSSKDVTELLLRAQIEFRRENYESAASDFETVLHTHGVSHAQLKTNLIATYALLAEQSGGVSGRTRTYELTSEDRETYELVYNLACSAIASHAYEEGEGLLNEAIETGVKSLKSDTAYTYTEAEINDELAIVRAQRGFLLQRTHDEVEALKIYEHVLSLPPSDQAVCAVVENNIVSTKTDEHMSAAMKKMKHAASEALDSTKLTSHQKQIIAFNRALVLLRARQISECRSLVDELDKRYPASVLSVLIRSALLRLEKRDGDAEECLASYVSESDGSGASEASKLAAQLTLAMVHLQSKKLELALETLRGAAAIRHQPGLVATLVDLCLERGERTQAVECLVEAHAHWRVKADEEPEQFGETYARVGKQFAGQLVHMGNYAEAVPLYEELLKHNSKDFVALTVLIFSQSFVDPAEADRLVERLPPMDEDEHDQSILDEDELEKLTTFVATSGAGVGGANVSATTAGGDAAVDPLVGHLRVRKRKHKPRLPKNYDPNRKPDPERWLPLKQRSYYKPKKGAKKGKGGGGGSKGLLSGPQGAVGGVGAVEEKSTPSSSQVRTSGNAGGGSAKKKKKGKKGKKGRR